MTNYEKIKAMTIDEIAVLLCEVCDSCASCKFLGMCDDHTPDADGAKKWLKQEASNGPDH